MKGIGGRSDSRLPDSRGVSPQVKICGLTSADEAAACAELGAHAVGCVFYPPSPRFVSDRTAREICERLPLGVSGVGVFVNAGLPEILEKVKGCGLKAVQLHGQESNELAGELQKLGIVVIKAFFQKGDPPLEPAGEYDVSAYLFECGGGLLPGGNALAWDWGAAHRPANETPVILAGGLTVGNVAQAIELASPDAVDVSSGVERIPGRKDMDKVKVFLETVARSGCSGEPRRIFR